MKGAANESRAIAQAIQGPNFGGTSQVSQASIAEDVVSTWCDGIIVLATIIDQIQNYDFLFSWLINLTIPLESDFNKVK